MMQARNFTRGRIAQVRLIVLHDMEAPEGVSTAENIAGWFAGPTAPRASAHYCVDSDSVVPCVDLADTAWHAPGANADGIGYEQAGFARQSRDEWLDAYSREVIRNTARQAALDAHRFGIPVRALSDAQLADGISKGVVTHAQVSRVFRRSDHVDPGQGYPLDVFLADMLGNTGPVPVAGAPAAPAAPRQPQLLAPAWPGFTFRATMRYTPAVAVWQRQMRTRGWGLAPDGVYGPASAGVASKFQREKGLQVDGCVGPRTWAASWAAPVT